MRLRYTSLRAPENARDGFAEPAEFTALCRYFPPEVAERTVITGEVDVAARSLAP